MRFVNCGRLRRRHTDNYGGYDRMVSQHVGKDLSEDQRARWANLMIQSATEAGLPTDPEFRAAFVAYIEWGTRIAVENSTPGAKPPRHMPVPRWWWVCDATPGSRVSALAVVPGDVADTADGWASDGGVVPVMVVEVEPGGQRSGALAV
jgi:hypothetical protein